MWPRAGEKERGQDRGLGAAAAGRRVIQSAAGSLLVAARLRGAADRRGIWHGPGAPRPGDDDQIGPRWNHPCEELVALVYRIVERSQAVSDRHVRRYRMPRQIHSDVGERNPAAAVDHEHGVPVTEGLA